MIIIDTSVAIKWLKSDEEGHEEAMHIYKNHNVRHLIMICYMR